MFCPLLIKTQKCWAHYSLDPEQASQEGRGVWSQWVPSREELLPPSRHGKSTGIGVPRRMGPHLEERFET